MDIKDIRFRVYSNKLDKYLDGNGNRFVYNDTLISLSILLTPEEYHIHGIDDEFRIEQYTGVIDTNEERVWEGDRVRLVYANRVLHDDNEFEVIFESGCFLLKPIVLPKGGLSNDWIPAKYIVGRDENDYPVYKYGNPIPKPLFNYRNIVEKISNLDK